LLDFGTAECFAGQLFVIHATYLDQNNEFTAMGY
jgi:hypothetical protein